MPDVPATDLPHVVIIGGGFGGLTAAKAPAHAPVRVAVIDFGWWRVRGLVGWLVWGVAHIYFLIGFRSKVMVMAEWIWVYLTFKKGMRLITRPFARGDGSDAGSNGNDAR